MNEPEGIKPYFKGPLTLRQGLKFKFRAGCIPLNSKLAHIHKCSRACSLCGAEVEDIPHFILHCPKLKTLRDALVSEISESATKTVLDSFNGLEDLLKAAAILSDSFWGDAQESINQCVMTFLADAWKLRCNHMYGAQSHYWVEPADSVGVKGISEGSAFISQLHSQECGVNGLQTKAR